MTGYLWTLPTAPLLNLVSGLKSLPPKRILDTPFALRTMSFQLSPALVSEFGWLNCFAIADSSRLPKGAGYDTRSVLADQSRDVGASCGWRGVNPIRDQVRPSSSLMLIRWQTYRSKGGL